MNQVIDTICGRTSIRKFSKRKVCNQDIKEILRAAMNAPSACNQQVWQFVVVDDTSVLQTLSDMHSGISFLKEAALAIVVCGEPKASVLDYFWEDDCAAATQNILLAVHALGLGATWSGINRKSADMVGLVQDTLHIPDGHIPFSIIAIGYSAEEKDVKDRYLNTKVHHNEWDSKWEE